MARDPIKPLDDRLPGKTGTTAHEDRAVNQITCAEPGCPNGGDTLVPMAMSESGNMIELEFCASHARQRNAVREA